MHAFLDPLIHFFFALGGVGLLLLATLDSSFLFLPSGNDLFLVALTAARPAHAVYYVLMAAVGSACGVGIAHVVSSRVGRKAIEGKKKSRRVAFVEARVKKYGGLAIAFAAVAPPGFPFTVFIVAAAALQYPLRRMLIIIAVGRAVRFGAEAWLAILYGKRILEMANSPLLQTALMIVIVLSIAGSAYSIYGWFRKARSA